MADDTHQQQGAALQFTESLSTRKQRVHDMPSYRGQTIILALECLLLQCRSD